MALRRNTSQQIEDKVFLVTGGAAGIGAGIVRALLHEDARFVAFLDIAEREGTALEKELVHKFGALKSKFIKCDISDKTQLLAAYDQVLVKCRRLDGVINNAAVLQDDDHYKKIIDVNFTAAVCSTLKAVDVMGEEKGGEGGCVVNLSSMLALTQTSPLPVYTATKTAILHFSNCIGAEENYQKTKVRVITVCLGPTDTAILQRYNLENFDKHSKSLTSRVPVRQRVESAALGVIDVIKQGASGSTWVIAGDKPSFDISSTINEARGVLSQYNEQ